VCVANAAKQLLRNSVDFALKDWYTRRARNEEGRMSGWASSRCCGSWSGVVGRKAGSIRFHLFSVARVLALTSVGLFTLLGAPGDPILGG
jgi:hypothetical protein